MGGMREHDVLVFLTSLAVLLSVARLLGETSRRLGFPLVFGELASGIVLGPTVLGRVAPAAGHRRSGDQKKKRTPMRAIRGFMISSTLL